MSIDTQYNYDILLSLDRAKLVGRSRINNLGSYELTLNYNLTTSGTKEDALEWLEANRLEIVDPKFSFKTYEGTWKCVSIEYDEDRKIIQQVFRIDAALGNLGDVDDEPNYSLQAGDLSRISDGMELQKAYYWRVVSPEGIVLPPTSTKGEIWSKTANDNGDGTYDVIVSKEVAKNQTATNESRATGFTEEADIETNGDEKEFGVNVTAPAVGEVKRIDNNPLENGKFRSMVATRTDINQTAENGVTADSYTEETAVETNGDEKIFGVNVDAATVGEIKRIDNTPLDNGKFRSVITTRTAIAQNTEFAYGSDYSAVGGLMRIGTNRTLAELEADILAINPSPWAYVLSVSARQNDYGLYDYTISGRI